MTIDESFRELGLPPGSTEAEVKEAWRRLAARWHPDRNKSPHALRRIQRINRAVEEIRQWRASGFADLQPTREPPADVPEDLVEQQVSISLEEACTGCSRELHGEVVEDCAPCHGSGHEARASTCQRCHGSGRTRPNFWFPWLAADSACETCAGTGRLHATCAACAGQGQARPRRYRCQITVPAGTRHGDVLHVHARVQGRQREHALHLRVSVALQPHALFRLEADGTVHCSVPVDGFAWVAERWSEVPSPRGLQQMRLRRNALTYRLRGHGLGGADCIVAIEPLFPEELGSDQQLLIDRLVASNTGARGSPAGKRMSAWQAELAAGRTREARR
jgi:DnaJ-class molecular chaperone